MWSKCNKSVTGEAPAARRPEIWWMTTAYPNAYRYGIIITFILVNCSAERQMQRQWHPTVILKSQR